MKLIEMIDVSRETLDSFVILLKEWNLTHNLVHKDTLENIYERHIFNSLELLRFLSDNLLIENSSYKLINCKSVRKSILDIGSGAGFPGMILAIAGVRNITLCESNGKKISFLRTVKATLNIDVNIIQKRVERIKNKYDICISRAFSSILKTLDFCFDKTQSFFLIKGDKYMKEIIEAQKNYDFLYEVYPGRISKNLKNVTNIILITDIKKHKNKSQHKT